MNLRIFAGIAVALTALCCTGTTVLGGGFSMFSAGAAAGCANQATSVDENTAMPSITSLTDIQLRNAATIIAAGKQRRTPRRAWVIAIATALQESTLLNHANNNPDYPEVARISMALPHEAVSNDNDSVGLFQQRPIEGAGSWGTVKELMTPTISADKFFVALLNVAGWETLPLTEAAQKVQHSAYPDAYAKHEPLATAIVNALAAISTDDVPAGEAGAVNCSGDGGDGLPADGAAGIPAGFALPTNSQQATAVSFALAQLGKPYVFGAEGPNSYDCSGLMQAAWAKAGVTIPRVTTDQVHAGIAVPNTAAMQPGDLIFIPGSDGTAQQPGHVGMYIGVGEYARQWLIQAPHTGDTVKITSVNSWSSQIVAIRRPLEQG